MPTELGPTFVQLFDNTYPEDLSGKPQYVQGYPLADCYVSSEFGPRVPIQTPAGLTSDFHSGIDLVAPFGTPVFAPAPCVVVFSGKDSTGAHIVTVRFADGTGAMFVHLDGPQIGVGTALARGAVVGFIGSTGLSTGPHLHYMRLRRVVNGAYWYAREDLIEPFSPEGGHVETPAPDVASIDVVMGEWPASGNGALVVTLVACTAEDIRREAEAAGVALRSVWAFVNGGWVGYTFGAPEAVNAAFPALVANQPLYVAAA